MADYKTPQWLLPNEKNLAYPASGAETGSGLSEDRHSLYSMDFDGTSYIDLGTDLDIFRYNINESYSVSLWYKTTSSAADKTIINLGANAYRFTLASASSGKITFGAGNSSTISVTYNWLPTAGAINDGNWHHICIVQDSSGGVVNLTAYVDGSSSGSGTSTTFITQSNNRIGDGHYGGIDGNIDEVAIWNKALSASEVSALSTADAPSNVMALNEKPYAYYPLGEQAQMGSANWSFPNGSLQSHVIDFDGTDEIVVPQFTLTAALSLSVWIKPDTLTGGQAMLFGDNDSNGYKIEFNSNTTIAVKNAGGNTSFMGSAWNTNEWQHLLITRDGSNNVTIYRNGVSWSTGTKSGNILFDRISGFNSSASHFDGQLSNIAIWNSDQTTNKDNIYNNGSPQSTYTVTPTAWWKLNAANSSYDTATSTWTFIDTETPAPNYTSALDFPGGTDYIDFGTGFPTTLGASATAATASGWVKINDLTQKQALFNITTSGGNYFGSFAIWHDPTSSKLYAYINGNANNIYLSSGITDNNWHHLAVVYDQSAGATITNGLKLYLDGSPVTPTASAGSTPAFVDFTASLITRLGWGWSNTFTAVAEMSNWAMWNSALTAGNITTLYNGGTPETIISLSPTSYYKLDNITTGIQDAGSSSNNGTITGTITETQTNVLVSNNGESDTLPTSALIPSDLQFESPYSNYSLSFDGATNYIDTNYTFPTISTWSVSFWVNINDPGNTNFYYHFTARNSSTAGLVIWSGNGSSSSQRNFSARINNTIITFSVASFDTWYNITVTGDGSNLTAYVDGVNVATTATSTLFPTLTYTTKIGSNKDGTNYFLNGKIDETAIWNTALTQAQITQVYNNGYPNDLTSLSPTSWWRLGEDAYFVGNDITIPNQITGGPTGTGSGTQTAILVGDAPGSYANGSGTNLAVEDRIGDAPESTANSVSINMIPSNRISYPAGYVPTQVDNAFSMEFDGVSNSKFNVNPPAIGSDNTISAWAKRVGTGNMFLFGNTNSGGYGCYFVGTSGVYVQGSGGYFAFTNSAVTTAMVRTDWVNWVFIKNSSAGTVSVYVDGELAQSASSTAGMDSLTSIGGSGLASGNQFPWNGNIDEVALFDYALSERQIKQDIYEGTTAGGKTADLNNISNLTAPVAWYRMGD